MPRRNISSGNYQANVPKRKFPNERSKATIPKRTLPSESFKEKDPKRKFPNERSQVKVPKRRIPNESSQTKDPKRKFPSKRSQAKDPEPKMTTNILENLGESHDGPVFLIELSLVMLHLYSKATLKVIFLNTWIFLNTTCARSGRPEMDYAESKLFVSGFYACCL